MASASPSTVAYLDSEGLRKRDPPKWCASHHRDSNGYLHSQCFWDREKPIPVFCQSGLKACASGDVEDLHPFLYGSSMMTSFDPSNALFISSDQVNFAFELKNFLNGAMMSINML